MTTRPRGNSDIPADTKVFDVIITNSTDVSRRRIIELLRATFSHVAAASDGSVIRVRAESDAAVREAIRPGLGEDRVFIGEVLLDDSGAWPERIITPTST